MPEYNMEKVAEVGYKAYVDSVGGKNTRDEEMPVWNALPSKRKKAWLDATEAITTTFNRFLTEAS